MTKSLTAREKAKATVAVIRAMYPEPVTAGDMDPTKDWYCVVTAYWRYIDKDNDYSCRRIMFGKALYEVVRENDAGNFELAWQLLEDALAEQPLK